MSEIIKLVPFTENEIFEVQATVLDRMLSINKEIKADPQNPEAERKLDEMKALSGITEKLSTYNGTPELRKKAH